jgi:hypothetical protein
MKPMITVLFYQNADESWGWQLLAPHFISSGKTQPNWESLEQAK